MRQNIAAFGITFAIVMTIGYAFLNRIASHRSWAAVGQSALVEQGGHVFGDAPAAQRVVVFVDYGCVKCVRFITAVRAIAHDQGIGVIIKANPTDKGGFGIAMAAECAGEQDSGKAFEEFGRIRFHLRTRLGLTPTTMAARLNIGDVPQFTTCMNNGIGDWQVRQDLRDAQAIGLKSNVGIFFHDHVYAGIRSQGELTKILKLKTVWPVSSAGASE